MTNERIEKLVYMYWNQRIRKELQGECTSDVLEAWEEQAEQAKQAGQGEEGEGDPRVRERRQTYKQRQRKHRFSINIFLSTT